MKTIACDLFRYTGEVSSRAFISQYCRQPEFRFVFWLRTTAALRRVQGLRLFHWGARFVLRRLRYKLGINIPYNTSIQPGLYIGHFVGINIHPEAVIGKNCNISSGVTIGTASRGKRIGVPTIGDNVYIGPGAKIFGKVRIGNNVAIGANCVVNEDIPDNAVVAANRGQIISYMGSAGYVTRILDGGRIGREPSLPPSQVQ